MNTARCASGCQKTTVPSQKICDDFFRRKGGRNIFRKQNLHGAKIHINGQQHECSTEEGPGEFGWCKVRYLFT